MRKILHGTIENLIIISDWSPSLTRPSTVAKGFCSSGMVIEETIDASLLGVYPFLAGAVASRTGDADAIMGSIEPRLSNSLLRAGTAILESPDGVEVMATAARAGDLN